MLFFDTETSEIITIYELQAKYEELRSNRHTEAETFFDYVSNCTDKNGTLEVIWEV